MEDKKYLKEVLKQAIFEALSDKKDFFSHLIKEALKDMAGIQESEKKPEDEKTQESKTKEDKDHKDKKKPNIFSSFIEPLINSLIVEEEKIEKKEKELLKKNKNTWADIEQECKKILGETEEPTIKETSTTKLIKEILELGIYGKETEVIKTLSEKAGVTEKTIKTNLTRMKYEYDTQEETMVKSNGKI